MMGEVNIPGMFITLWLFCVAFLAPVDKRPRGNVRMAGLLALALAADGIVVRFWPPPAWAPPAAIFVFAILFFAVCGDMPLSGALYGAVWAQISRQLVAETYLLIRLFVSSRVEWGPVIWFCVATALFGTACAAIAFTVARWMAPGGKYVVGPRQLTLCLVFQVVFEVLCRLLISNIDTASADFLYPVSIWLAQCYCATMLYFQYTLFSKSAMKKELDILNRLWYEQEEQYRLSRENIAIINRKCHDLKHQIAALRTISGRESREKYLREIEDSVRIYDSILKTGNDVLDTVLTEKNLYCEANGIRVSCVADGRRLSFMDPVDLYAMLGNALDNAIEAVQRFSDPERKMIDILICARQQFLLLRISNPLEGGLTFCGDLPMSTKARDGYHGFGLKSIRHTALKYGGHTCVTTENGQFILNILLPLDGQG